MSCRERANLRIQALNSLIAKAHPSELPWLKACLARAELQVKAL